jgi:hypothetical protein
VTELCDDTIASETIEAIAEDLRRVLRSLPLETFAFCGKALSLKSKLADPKFRMRKY